MASCGADGVVDVAGVLEGAASDPPGVGVRRSARSIRRTLERLRGGPAIHVGEDFVDAPRSTGSHRAGGSVEPGTALVRAGSPTGALCCVAEALSASVAHSTQPTLP